MTVFVYALKNQINDEIYVGISADLDRRLKEHNSGKNRYTKAFLPWTLFFTESCDSYAEARKREIYYKSVADIVLINVVIFKIKCYSYGFVQRPYYALADSSACSSFSLPRSANPSLIALVM